MVVAAMSLPRKTRPFPYIRGMNPLVSGFGCFVRRDPPFGIPRPRGPLHTVRNPHRDIVGNLAAVADLILGKLDLRLPA